MNENNERKTHDEPNKTQYSIYLKNSENIIRDKLRSRGYIGKDEEN